MGGNYYTKENEQQSTNNIIRGNKLNNRIERIKGRESLGGYWIMSMLKKVGTVLRGETIGMLVGLRWIN